MYDSDAMKEDTLAVQAYAKQATFSTAVMKEDSAVVQAHVKQATVSTAVSPDDGLSATDRLCCSDDYLYFHNIKCETEQPEVKNEDHANCQQISSDDVHNEQLEAMQEDRAFSQQSSSDDGRIHTTLNSVDSEIPQFNEHDSVELVLKSDGDERDSNCELPRRWIVCENGVLKAVKAEPILSDSLTDVDCGMTLDTDQELNEKNHADTKETRSHSTPQVSFTNPGCLNTRETSDTGSASSGLSTKDDCSLMCAICGKKFKSSNTLKVHKRVHTAVKPFTRTTCGRSFSRLDILKVHETVHTGVKPFACETCGKAFAQPSSLSRHRRTGRGGQGGQLPPQFGQFVDMNSGRECKLFGQNPIHV